MPPTVSDEGNVQMSVLTGGGVVKTTLVVDGGEVDLTVVVPPSQDSVDENASIPVIRSPGASGTLSRFVRGE